MQTLGMTGTKWDFFVAAIDLFAAKGYTNVSIRDIAKTLNIKAASMYNHFANKDALLQQIYEFCHINYEAALPNLDNLIKLIPTTPPQEILKQLTIPFKRKSQNLVTKCMQIILEEMDRDKRAAKLADRIFVDVPNSYVKTVLLSMAEQGKIEPIDIDAFIILYASFDIYAVSTSHSKFSLSLEDWLQGHEFLFSIIKAKD